MKKFQGSTEKREEGEFPHEKREARRVLLVQSEVGQKVRKKQKNECTARGEVGRKGSKRRKFKEGRLFCLGKRDEKKKRAKAVTHCERKGLP